MAERLAHVLPQRLVPGIEDGALRGAEVHEEPIGTQCMASPGCRQRGRFSDSQGPRWGRMRANSAADGSWHPQPGRHSCCQRLGHREGCPRAVTMRKWAVDPKPELVLHDWSTFYTKLGQEWARKRGTAPRSHHEVASPCAHLQQGGAGGAPVVRLWVSAPSSPHAEQSLFLG